MARQGLWPLAPPDGTFAPACFLASPTLVIETAKQGNTRKVRRTFQLP